MPNVIIERGRVWDIDELPNNSIALDGAVRGPIIDTINNKYSFDHHDNCIRHCTLATCQQVMNAILLGLNVEDFNIYINDIDADTVASLFCIYFPETFKKNEGSYLRSLVDIIGKIDSNGPSYPLEQGENGLLKAFHKYVMHQTNNSKKDGTYSDINLKELMNECIERMHEFIFSDVVIENTSNDERKYNITFETEHFIMAESADFIFDKLYEDGYSKAVAYMRLKNNTYAYSIGKKSEFVDFPVSGILNELNKYEPGWGGSSTIGGAPRNQDGTRSSLTPNEVFEIITNFIMK